MINCKSVKRYVIFGIFVAIMAVFLFALYIAYKANEIMSTAIPRDSYTNYSDNMNKIHIIFGDDGDQGDLYIPGKYIAYKSPDNRFGNALVRLRFSFNKLISSVNNNTDHYDEEMSNISKADDMVQVVIKHGRSGGTDRFFDALRNQGRFEKTITDFNGFSVFESQKINHYKDISVLLLPNSKMYHDMFIEQSNGLDSTKPCTEYFNIEKNISVEMMFEFSHISQWQDLDKSIRQLINRFQNPTAN
jgi:hypothetical protein